MNLMEPVDLDGKGAAGRPDYEIYVFLFVQNTNTLRKEELHLLQQRWQLMTFICFESAA